jgi:hypothetical protein
MLVVSFTKYVAIGDSFTEGVGDPDPTRPNGMRGWADRVAEVLARFDGCTTAKVKVAERGQGIDDDVDRVAAVRDVMGADARIRVDANGGWDESSAADALARLAAYDLEYAEQPCATVEELARLRKTLARNGIDVPIAADESIRKAEDPVRVARLGAADLVVVKVAPLGGVEAALEVVAACGLSAVVSSALDTSIGIAPSPGSTTGSTTGSTAGSTTGSTTGPTTSPSRARRLAGRWRSPTPPTTATRRSPCADRCRKARR